jgi:hypothetical protein
MNSRVDSLDIICPKCNKSHKYTLEIHRSIVMYHLGVPTKTKEHKFTRIFICPETGKKFQACIVVTQQAGEILHDVVPVLYSSEESKANEEE